MLYFPAYSAGTGAIAKFPSLKDDPSGADLPEIIEQHPGFNVGKKYYIDAATVDIYGELGKFATAKDVMICHGTKDTTVNIRNSEKAEEMYASVTLHRIEGAGHNFRLNPKYTQETNAYCLDYLQEHTLAEL